jgi:hypothetical protein
VKAAQNEASPTALRREITGAQVFLLAELEGELGTSVLFERASKTFALGAALATWGLDSAFSPRSRRVVTLGYFNNNCCGRGVPRTSNSRSGHHAVASPRPK